LTGEFHDAKELFPGGFRYISKAVDGGMPVIFDIRESSLGLLSFSAKQGTLKVQKDGFE
jgi:hypothetical protein